MATDIKKMLGEYMLAWNSHDVDKILSFFTDDGIYEDVALGIVKHGKKEIVEFTNSMLLDSPDVKFELKAVFGTVTGRAVNGSCRVRLFIVAYPQCRLLARPFQYAVLQSYSYVKARLAEKQTITIW